MDESTKIEAEDSIARQFYDRARKIEYTCADVESALQLVKRLHTGPQRQLWYRGQADAQWKLIPGVFRRDDHAGFEVLMVRHFQRAAPVRYPRCPPRDNQAGWLQLMQHYRAPTRLLDWTQSPLVALFFAAESMDHADGDLWILDPWRLNAAQHVAGLPGVDQVPDLVGPAFGQASTRPSTRAAAVAADQLDHRMATQLSAFTIHGDATPLEVLTPRAPWLGRVRIPSRAKQRILLQLHQLGIRRSSLFLDLENLARELASYTAKPPVLDRARLRMKP